MSDMTGKIITAIAALLLCSAFCANAQMSDEAIISYITEAAAAGKSKSQIGNELIAKGVTAAQAKRLMETYRKNAAGGDVMTGNVSPQSLGSSGAGASRTISEAPGPDGGIALVEGMPEETADSMAIFGHDMFNKKNLTFEPNQNMATPTDYVLGPGDEIHIDIFGMNEDSINCTVSAEGKVIISNVGPVQLSGLTIEQATKKLRKLLASKYSLGGRDAQSDMAVSLAKIRTIQVNVLGEVSLPGTYRLSSLSNVMNAIYHAGGVTPIGSLRAIKLVRGGETLATVDLYEMIFDGKVDKRWSLKEGDVIIVPAYEALVEVRGAVKRPMIYEAAEGETMDRIIRYAGGFASNAHEGSVSVSRNNGAGAEVFTVDAGDYAAFSVEDGDIVEPYVNNTRDVFANKVTIEGCVLRPGVYEIGGGLATVRQLVEKAGGLLEEAFLPRAQLVRENEDRTARLQGIAIGAVMDGDAEDVLLRRHDVLIISSVLEIEKKGDVEIYGHVSNPGAFKYADGMTIEDLILMAGGLEEGASSVSVEVGRRILVEDSTMAMDTIARVFTCNIEGDLAVAGDSKFTLAPYDVVSVRKNPTFIQQRKVLVSGEVNFPGTYTLEVNNERLSDVLAKAGGATRNANISGASLRRTVSEYERMVRRNMENLVQQGVKLDSLQIEKMKISETYTVGINLEKALANPGSEEDVVLQDGDEITVPDLVNTVRVQGEVNYPNAVNYVPGKNLQYYVNQSGGWATNAKRNKSYVIYMNGKVAVGRSAKIQPGCEVVVPPRPDKRKMTGGEWAGIGTAAASMAASIASMITLIINTSK